MVVFHIDNINHVDRVLQITLKHTKKKSEITETVNASVLGIINTMFKGDNKSYEMFTSLYDRLVDLTLCR